MSAPSPTRPTVLFVCVHNAGRSQMAAGYLAAMSRGSVDVRSAGSEPAESLNPVAVEAMAEEGIDITASVPTILRTEQVRASDVVITMGCGDTCPVFPGRRYEDWDLDDPAGQPLADVRRIRDDIKARVAGLLSDLQGRENGRKTRT
ncbi:arsenate reductase ArsC [Kocuria marina]|uniref:arsenate reductase ArsC n=1 Tax=Kocuria marina TaxID=223184 RepID=UPI0022E358DF|nr:arsenate reductase ArsC [Kocuria marina]